MKNFLLFLTTLLVFTGCTFGNESIQGVEPLDYAESIFMWAGILLAGFGGFKFYKGSQIKGKDDASKDAQRSLQSTGKILALVGAIIALGFFLAGING